MINLITDKWIPVRHKSGNRKLISPLDVFDPVDPVLSVDATRTPWNAALTEFLIALYQTALFPEDAAEWRRLEKPSQDELRKALLGVTSSFDLEGNHPFMQDRSLLLDGRDEDYRKPIQKFLVDGVSEQQEKNNSDLFERSGTISSLCAPCAAAAIYDMQAHAPQGSAGYYTSLRGGGPSSTIVIAETLWETIWANLLEQSCFGMKGRPDPAKWLPWMAPEPGPVKPSEVCPLHVYWGMPRRVVLERSETSSVCDLCGGVDGVYKSFFSYRGGNRYMETDWRHPLSPYIRSKEGGWLVRATEPDLAGYRHYMGLLVDTPAGDGVPAMVVRRAVERGLNLRVWGYGYQCDQAMVVRWCEGVMPVETGSASRGLIARTLVALTQRGVERLSDAIRGVWDESNAGGVGKAAEKAMALWSDTAQDFQGALSSGKPEEEVLDQWMTLIRRAALSIYRDALPRSRVDAMWAARFEHKLMGQLSSRNPMTLKTRKFGDWRIEESVSVRS